MSTLLRSSALRLALWGAAAFGLATSASAQILINEFDADQTGTDNAEFVELIGPANGSLSGMSLVLFNGSSDVSYASFDLSSQSLGADGLFVLCGSSTIVAGCDLVVSPATNLIQNGEDAIALYMAPASSFPTGTAPTTTGLVDAVVYGTLDPRDLGLLSALGRSVQFEDELTTSLQRLNVGMGRTGLFYPIAPTPGALNPSQYTVTVPTAAIFNPSSTAEDGEGYRFVGAPVVDPTGAALQVGDFAQINLIQGVPSGTANPPQYPNSGDNFFPSFFGNAFLPAPNTDLNMFPGRGAAWYFYDENITPTPDPSNPGTSVSYELSNPAFQLSATGLPYDDVVNGGPYTFVVRGAGTDPGDTFYLIANPYAYPVRLGGLSVSSGTLSTTFQAYDPATGSYVPLTADTANPSAGAALPVWNGAFAEVTGASGAPTFAVSSASADPTASASFYGRETTTVLALDLSGTLADGTPVADLAAQVRLLDDALVTWDRHDASKATSPAAQYAHLAPVGERDGAPRRQAVLSLPTSLSGSNTFPVAFTATQAGSFTITPSGVLPTGLQAQLRDLVTGTVVALGTAGTYSFSADAGDWSNRFELVIGQNVVADGDAPAAFLVGEVSPNPTAGTASIRVQMTTPGPVQLEVYDALGRRVAVVADQNIGTEAQIALPTAGLAPGAYLVRIAAEGDVVTRRLTVLR